MIRSTGLAWAVGERLNARYQDRALIEVWNGTRWTIADNPQQGSVRDMLFGASALSPSDVWVVGDREGGNGLFETLAEHWNGRRWSVCQRLTRARPATISTLSTPSPVTTSGPSASGS